MNNQKKINKDQISRKNALKKIGNYGKYAALTAIGTYTLLNPKKAQAQSPTDPGNGFWWIIKNPRNYRGFSIRIKSLIFLQKSILFGTNTY